MSSLWASCGMSYFAFVRWWIYNWTGDCFGFLSMLSGFITYYFLWKWISNIQFVYVAIPPVFVEENFKMKNCLWSRNWKQSVQCFKGLEPMQVSIISYSRSGISVSVSVGSPNETRMGERTLSLWHPRQRYSRSGQGYSKTESLHGAKQPQLLLEDGP